MTDRRDEDWVYFLDEKGFGPPSDRRDVPDASLARFGQRLPAELLNIWKEFGWCSFGRGLFWLVDPDEYEPVLEAWIGDTVLMEQDEYHVIARSAFGDVFLWGRKSGQSLDIKAPWGMMFPRDNSERVAQGKADRLIKSFVVGQKKEALDQRDHLDKPLFDRALKALGPLRSDQMYGFEPALALGGKADIKGLRKVDAVAHLVTLAQLGERRVMQDVAKEAKRQGLL